MSGGVDSSLAAALLQDAGYEVFGIHLKLWADPGYQDNMANLEQVCRSLNIPLHELNLEGEFHSLVISYFCREYSRGRTPNPCLVCNKDIKFGRLLHRALEMGADYLASGHYARVEGYSDYRAFLAGYLPVEPGDITDTSGKTLGKHSGLAHYTVGQRQGLGLSSAERQYVLRLDTSGNRLVVGSESQLLSRRLIARKLSWVAGRPPPNLNQITARIRYRSPETPVTLSLNAETAEVEFHEPQRAVAPGQAIVFYQGDAVLGGGIIEESLE